MPGSNLFTITPLFDLAAAEMSSAFATGRTCLRAGLVGLASAALKRSFTILLQVSSTFGEFAMRLTSRRYVLRPALFLLAVATAPGAFAAEAAALSVMIDHAKVMHISRPAEVVIVGNPGIADATIQDQQTLIITGRSFGSTNLIVLDASGKAISEETLSVVASSDNVVTMYR